MASSPRTRSSGGGILRWSSEAAALSSSRGAAGRSGGGGGGNLARGASDEHDDSAPPSPQRGHWPSGPPLPAAVPRAGMPALDLNSVEGSSGSSSGQQPDSWSSFLQQYGSSPREPRKSCSGGGGGGAELPRERSGVILVNEHSPTERGGGSSHRVPHHRKLRYSVSSGLALDGGGGDDAAAAVARSGQGSPRPPGEGAACSVFGRTDSGLPSSDSIPDVMGPAPRLPSLLTARSPRSRSPVRTAVPRARVSYSGDTSDRRKSFSGGGVGGSSGGVGGSPTSEPPKSLLLKLPSRFGGGGACGGSLPLPLTLGGGGGGAANGAEGSAAVAAMVASGALLFPGSPVSRPRERSSSDGRPTTWGTEDGYPSVRDLAPSLSFVREHDQYQDRLTLLSRSVARSDRASCRENPRELWPALMTGPSSLQLGRLEGAKSELSVLGSSSPRLGPLTVTPSRASTPLTVGPPPSSARPHVASPRHQQAQAAAAGGLVREGSLGSLRSSGGGSLSNEPLSLSPTAGGGGGGSYLHMFNLTPVSDIKFRSDGHPQKLQALYGVTMKYLLEFARRIGRSGELGECGPDELPPRAATSADVFKRFILPHTVSQRCKFIDLVPKKHIMVPVLFISHAHESSFAGLINAILRHCSNQGMHLSATAIFIDLFCINPHTPGMLRECMDGLRATVATCKHLVWVIDHKGTSLTRLWCWFEAWLAAMSTRASAEALEAAAMPSAQAALAGVVLANKLQVVYDHVDLESALGKFASQDVARMHLHDEKDRKGIEGMMQAMGQDAGGIRGVVAVVSHAMQLSAASTHNAFARKKDRHIAQYLSASLYLSSTLVLVGRSWDAEKVLRQDVLWAKQRAASRHDLLPLISNLATLMKMNNFLEEAERLCTEALEMSVVAASACGRPGTPSLGSSAPPPLPTPPPTPPTSTTVPPTPMSAMDSSATTLLPLSLLLQPPLPPQQPPVDVLAVLDGSHVPLAGHMLLLQLTDVLDSRGDVERAERFCRRLLECAPEHKACVSRGVSLPACHLARILTQRGDVLEARRVLQDNLEALGCGGSLSELAALQYSLGTVLQAMGAMDDACAAFSECCQTRLRGLGAHHVLTLVANVAHAGALVAAKQLDDAEPLLELLHGTVEKSLGTTHALALELQRHLTALQEALVSAAREQRLVGTEAKAEELLRRALNVAGVSWTDACEAREAAVLEELLEVLRVQGKTKEVQTFSKRLATMRPASSSQGSP